MLIRSQESTDDAPPEIRAVALITRWPIPLALAIVIGAAILIRAFTLVVARSAAIDMDGAEYVRVAENLASGNGPVGMRGLPMITFPLLYSGAIALGVRMGGNPELVALAIASLSGVALAFLMYRLALAVYGRETAIYAAAIAAVLPICVETSTSAITEAPFAVLGTLGLLNMVWFVRDGRARHAAIAGASFGAASLLRPEGLLFALSAVVVIAIVTLAYRRSAIPLAAFSAAAAAFVVASLGITYAASGRLALEGKTAINFSLADGLRTGATYLSVADAVDRGGRPVGPEIDLRYYTPGETPPTLPASRRAALAMRAAINHVGESLRLFSDPAYGGGLLIVLAVLGIAGAAWSRGGARDQLVLFAYLATGFVALAGVWQFWPRYGMMFIPVVILWAAHGVGHLRRWSRASRLPDVGLGAFAALLVVSVAVDIAAGRAVDRPLERSAAAWITAHGPRAPLIADVSTRTAFYAHGVWRPLPYGDERASERYLRAINPAYIVIDSRRGDQYPPIRAWFQRGMPAKFATLVYEARDPAGRTLSVYRLVPAVSYKRG